jgi:6-phosphogluconolactonase
MNGGEGPELTIQPDRPRLFRAAAQRLTASARQEVAGHGAFHWALAGGSTPQGLYELLATSEFAGRIPWAGIHAWFGDERCVPPDHEQSNYRMARTALLDRVPLPAERVHRLAGEEAPAAAADAYAEAMARSLPQADGVPVLDLVLLGLGPDGHVASLFPGTPALEATGWVTAVHVPALDAWRLSLTLPVINAARRVWLLASGPDKAAIVRAAAAPPGSEPLPVQCLAPRGEWVWFLDQAAAAELSPPPDPGPL